MSWLSREELEDMRFGALGENLKISRNAVFHNCANIFIGDNVRVSDFSVVSAGEGGVHIGRYTHLGVQSSVLGPGKVTFEEFCGVSAKVSFFSGNDDYSGDYLIGPTVPDKYKNVTVEDIFIGRHAVIGSGSIILPGVTMHEGAAIGSLSLVKDDCEAFTIYAGTPAKKVKERKRGLLKLREELLASC